VTLSNPINASLGTNTIHTYTINDNDPLPGLFINDISVNEGDTGTTSAVFTVSMSAPSDQVVTVVFATADGGATAPADYAATTGSLTFNPGQTTATIIVPVNGDTEAEWGGGNFFVNLLNATNATMSKAQGSGYIVDNELWLYIIDARVTEGDAGATSAVFTVVLTEPSTQPVTVNYATADATATAPGDYVEANGTLTFEPGMTQLTIAVTVNGDTISEPTETFRLSLSDAVNATVRNDPTCCGNRGLGSIVTDDVHVPDFNGDGKAGILLRDASTGQHNLRLMDGSNVVSQGPIAHAVMPPDWTIQGFADFNGDGKRDIFWRHTDGTSDVWLMDGFNVIASSNLRLNGPFLDTGWQFRGFGDFDVDGKTDVFWQHTDGSTNVWLMDGDSVWQQGGYGVDVVGAGWQIKGFGDFDGDGTTDVLWMHGNGMVRFWQMYGVYGWSPDPLGPYAGWEIQGVGDFNGDAMSDVFWRATGTSGTTMVWLMGEMGWGGGYFEWGEWGYVYSPDNPYLELMISGAQAIGFRDFNGDEKTDVLWNRAEFEANFTWQIDGFSASC
jgi:hypothetical protein